MGLRFRGLGLRGSELRGLGLSPVCSEHLSLHVL